MKMKFMSQPRVKGGRQFLSAGFIEALEKAILAEQKRFTVNGRVPSRSFIIATSVAYALGVDEQADYAEPTRTVGARRKLLRRA